MESNDEKLPEFQASGGRHGGIVLFWDCDDCGSAAQHGEARRGPKTAVVQGPRRIYRAMNSPADFGFERRFRAQ